MQSACPSSIPPQTCKGLIPYAIMIIGRMHGGTPASELHVQASVRAHTQTGDAWKWNIDRGSIFQGIVVIRMQFPSRSALCSPTACTCCPNVKSCNDCKRFLVISLKYRESSVRNSLSWHCKLLSVAMFWRLITSTTLQGLWSEHDWLVCTYVWHFGTRKRFFYFCVPTNVPSKSRPTNLHVIFVAFAHDQGAWLLKPFCSIWKDGRNTNILPCSRRKLLFFKSNLPNYAKQNSITKY